MWNMACELLLSASKKDTVPVDFAAPGSTHK
jgi:hypothetical protein